MEVSATSLPHMFFEMRKPWSLGRMSITTLFAHHWREGHSLGGWQNPCSLPDSQKTFGVKEEREWKSIYWTSIMNQNYVTELVIETSWPIPAYRPFLRMLSEAIQLAQSGSPHRTGESWAVFSMLAAQLQTAVLWKIEADRGWFGADFLTSLSATFTLPSSLQVLKGLMSCSCLPPAPLSLSSTLHPDLAVPQGPQTSEWSPDSSSNCLLPIESDTVWLGRQLITAVMY